MRRSDLPAIRPRRHPYDTPDAPQARGAPCLTRALPDGAPSPTRADGPRAARRRGFVESPRAALLKRSQTISAGIFISHLPLDIMHLSAQPGTLAAFAAWP